MPDAFISAGHEIAPEFREYERLSTVVLNAYLGPVMDNYIRQLSPRLEALGMTATPHLTQSNGGVIGFATAAEMPVRTVLSGPSTGVVGAQAIGRLAGFEDLITFDMGGTSTDVALLQGGRCRLAAEATVHGYPIKAPMLDIHTVGAGGGSIAYIDSGGLLKVGPALGRRRSRPGLLRQGQPEPAVTDANVVLQTLEPAAPAGRPHEDPPRPRRAARSRGLAGRLGLGVPQTAQGILSVVTANMARAIRVISVQRGHDPRDYTLMAFGGAGPLHAARLARELEIGRVLVPANPGILCAMGLLLTDLRADFAATRLMPATEASTADVAEGFAALAERAERWFEHEGIAPADRRITRTVDMRYHGQNYELSVAVPDGSISKATLQALGGGLRRRASPALRFRRRRRSGADRHPARGGDGHGAQGGALRRIPRPGRMRRGAIAHRRPVWLAEAGDFVDTPIYARDALRPGNRFTGPAIVEQMDATTWCCRAWTRASIVSQRI